jgi:hypothetical protein
MQNPKILKPLTEGFDLSKKILKKLAEELKKIQKEREINKRKKI